MNEQAQHASVGGADSEREALTDADIAALARDMYELGRSHGQPGIDPAWVSVSDAYEAGARGQTMPEHTPSDIETRRWGPGGRAHFADARPGDFPGRNPRPEPQREAEAG